MPNTDPKKEITAAKKALVKRIREYARSQKALWQRVPWLALEADGRTGHGDNNSRAYRLGVWALRSSARVGHYHVYVDLATGVLIDPFTFHHKKGRLDPASNDAILALADRIDELDAAALVAELEQKAKEPHGSYYSAAEKRAWRENIRKERGLEKVFTATQRAPVLDPGLFD